MGKQKAELTSAGHGRTSRGPAAEPSKSVGWTSPWRGAVTASGTARILARRVGYQRARRILAPPDPGGTAVSAVQPKLAINTPGDAYEREADRVADAVTRGATAESGERGAGATLHRCACGGTCAACRGEEEEPAALQRDDDGGGAQHGFAPPIVHQVLASGGRPLEAGARATMEERLGAGFGGVRVHTGGRAAESARAVNAHAYTVGRDMVFAEGRYAPGTRDGDRLIAHELTHVLQQGGAPRGLQRAGGGGCEIELCFNPIGMLNLGAVGGVHGVLNLRQGGGWTHYDVNPLQHEAEGPGGVTPLPHSHVSRGPGRQRGANCQVIPATCAQVSAARRAAEEYEDLSVTYVPTGPNSNSFPEWVLTRAGISTAGIGVPEGAVGWGYYPANAAARAAPPRATHRADQMRCRGPIRPARDFYGLIRLVREAEARMIACGITDVQERVHQLRGIYYGTLWSMDYSVERSPVRNFFFQEYTGSSTPADPRSCLPCEVYLSLARSQDVRHRGSSVDFGHLLIGMDARRSTGARTSVRILEGVTGLEASTWVGDLGGAAARVALDRASGIPGRRATHYFRGSNYGGSINLEGDVAGYLVGAGPGAAATGAAPPLSIPSGATIADVLQLYLLPPAASPTGWNSRCGDFLQALGGTLAGTALTNRAAVHTFVADRIHNFACSYMANFLRQRGRGDATLCMDAARHLEGASREVAEVFIAALEYCAAHPGRSLQARGAGPAPSPIGSGSFRCAITCSALGVTGSSGGGSSTGAGAADLLNRGREMGGRAVQEAEERLDQLRAIIPFGRE